MFYRTLTLLFFCFGIGCDDLDDFQTGPDEVFRGTIAGNDVSDDESFIRSGFKADTTLELTFDPDFSLQSVESQHPGMISTFPPNRESEEGGDSAGRFQKTALDTIDPLSHDLLNHYTFPGGGRIRNYIFSATFEEQRRSAMVFVSLMENKDIEVRIIAPSTPMGCVSDSEPFEELYGVFRLKRESK